MSASNLAWLTQSGTDGVFRQLALLPQVLRCLDVIRKNANPPGDWGDALKTLISAADSGTAPDGIEASDWQALLAEWAALKTKLQGALPDALKPLTYKLSDLLGATAKSPAVAGLLTYPLSTGANVAGTVTEGGLSFATNASANASAAIDFQVYDTAPDWATEMGYVEPDAECLVRLGVHGQLTASASASAAPVWGSIGLNAGADASLGLDYCFNFAPSRYVAQVLIDSVSEMFAPGDLDGALEACRQGSDFCMSVTEISGDLKLGGQLGVGYSWGVASISLGSADATPIDFGAQLGIKAGFDWAVSGGYRTIIESAGGIAVLRIERSSHNSTSISVSLNAEIDIQGLQASLTPIIDKMLPSSASLTAKLGDLTDIQGLALKAVSKQLGLTGTGKWDDVATLLLKANLASTADRPGAVAALASALSDKFDALGKSYLGGIDGDISSATTQLNDAIRAALGGNALTDEATKLVGNASSAVSTAIDAAYAQFAGFASKSIGDIAKALALTPDTVGNALADLNKKVADLTKPLVQWITRYEALRTRIASAIARVQQQKLALAWSHTYQKSNDQSTIVEVKFFSSTPASQRLFSEMRAGRLSNYAALLEACGDAAAQSQWLMTDVLQRTVTDSLTFNFFGLIATSATVTAIDRVSVSVDSTGRIVVASDAVSLSAALTARNRLTQATIDLNLQMLASNALPPLSSTFSASGDAFTLQDEVNFFGLLTDAGAVGGDVASSVRKLLWSGAASSAATLTNAELSVLFTPDSAGWTRLATVAPGDLQVAVRKRCLALLGLALKRDDEGGVPDGTPEAWVKDWTTSAQLSENDFWSIADGTTWSGMYNELIDRASLNFPSAASAGIPASPLQRAVRKLWQIQRISRGVHDAWLNMQQVNDLFAQARANLPGFDRKRASKQLADCSDRIRNGLTQVFTGEVADPGKPTKVNWQFLSLIMTLSDIANPGAATQLLTQAKAKVGGVDVGYVVI